MANTPLPQYYRKAFQDFSGGLSTRPDALSVAGNKFVQLDNAILADHDILEKSPGYVLDGSPFPASADSFIRLLINFRVGVSVNSLVVAAQDNGNTNATYKVDFKRTLGDGTYSYIGHTVGTAQFTSGSAAVVGTGTSWLLHLKAGDKIKPNLYSNWYEILVVVDNTHITLTSNYTDTTTASVAYMARIIWNKSKIPEGLVFNNKLILTNESEIMAVYDNTTVNLIQDPDAPRAAKLAKHKRRVFALRTAANTSNLYWSGVDDESVWDPNSVAPIFPKDNGNGVGMVSFAGSLIIFKDNGLIYRVVGEFDQDAVGAPATIALIDVPDNIGIIAGKSVVVNDDNKIYFLAETGVYTIDSYMNVEKVSWDIDPTVHGLVINSTATSSNQFSYATVTQWNTGTNDGTVSRSPGTLAPFFDTVSVVGCTQVGGCLSNFIDSSNNVHVGYADTTQKKIKYVKWLATDNSYTQETAADFTSVLSTPNVRVEGVSISVAPNGNVGIATKVVNTVSTNVYYYFSERVSGSWSSALAASVLTGYRAASTGTSLCYTTGSEPRILGTQGGGVNGSRATYARRSVTTWTSNDAIDSPAFLIGSMVLDGSDNPYIAMYRDGTSDTYYYKSTDDGVSWSIAVTNTAAGVTSPGVGSLSISLNEKTQPVIVYNYTAGANPRKGMIVRWNPTTAVVTQIDANHDNVLHGYSYSTPGNFYWETKTLDEKFIFDTSYSAGTASFTNGNAAVTGQNTRWLTNVVAGDFIRLASDAENLEGTVLTVNSDTSITLTAVYAGGTSATAAYSTRRVNSMTNPMTNPFSNSYYIGDRGMTHNGRTFACCAYGINANEFVLRRLAFQALWTSPEMSDAGLTAWGTFLVSGQTLNGNSVVYQVGLRNTSPVLATSYAPITSGSVISTDNTLIFASATALFTIAGFNASQISSAILNYTGTGADGKFPVSFVFNNEMYLSATQNGQGANNLTIFLDRRHAWGDNSVRSSAYARMLQTFYTGSSTGGDVFKLKQGYSYNGSAYTMTAVTKEDILGSIELQKDIAKVYVLYRKKAAGTFTFSYRLDSYQNDSGSTWYDTTIDQTVSGVAEVPIGKTGSSIQFKITQADAGVNVAILGFIVMYGYCNVR